jgi:predicted nucleotidyltransferase component of viral defense system
MKKPISNYPASVKAKLLAYSRKNKLEHNQVLAQYAVERVLYRLTQTRHKDRFLLKGAMLFMIWEGALHRPTTDLDLLGFGETSVSNLEKVFQDVAKIEFAEDGIIFDPNSVEGAEIRAQEEYAGVRIIMRAGLGSSVIPVQIDVGFGDAVSPPPQEIPFPSLLGLPSAVIKAYQIETTISEKLHAIVKLGFANSRMKDYFDLFYISKTFSLSGDVLTSTIRATFDRRKDLIVVESPVGLTEDFAQDSSKAAAWKAFNTKMQRSAETAEFNKIVRQVADFILPAFKAALLGGEIPGTWSPPGPWTKK